MLLIYKDSSDNYRFNVGDIVRTIVPTVIINKGTECEIVKIDKDDNFLPYKIRPLRYCTGGWWYNKCDIELVRRG